MNRNGIPLPQIFTHTDLGLPSAPAESDCACPAWGDATSAPRPQVSSHTVLRPVLSPVIRVDGEYSALLSPGQADSLAVLNTSALRIWQAFNPPRTLGDVSDSLAHELPTISVQQTAAQLAALGLLADRLFVPPVPRRVLLAWLHVTNACNLRCTYCYVRKSDEHMDAQTARLAVEAVFRSARQGGYDRVKLKYAGGEPLLHFGRVLEMHDYAAELAARDGITLEGVILTNGVGLNNRHLDAIAARGLRLMISLDGVGAAHDAQRAFANGRGSFAAVERAIEHALARQVIPHLSITVTARSAGDLPQAVAWALDRDLPFALNFYRDTDQAVGQVSIHRDTQSIIEGMRAAYAVIEQRRPAFNLLASLADRANLALSHVTPCAAGDSYLVIGQDGRVAKCHMQMDQPVGDVSDHDLLAAVRTDRDGVQNVPVDRKEGCRTCEWKYWCAGGCPVETFRATGRYDVPSPNCDIYRALYPEVVRLEALRLLRLTGERFAATN